MGVGEDGPLRHVFRYLVDEDPVEGGQIVLDADDSRHLVKVVRRQVGDPVEDIDAAGDLWPCEVVSTGNPAVVRVCGPARPAPAVAPLAPTRVRLCRAARPRRPVRLHHHHLCRLHLLLWCCCCCFCAHCCGAPR